MPKKDIESDLTPEPEPTPVPTRAPRMGAGFGGVAPGTLRRERVVGTARPGIARGGGFDPGSAFREKPTEEPE